jgi:hypothetical protein
MSASFAWLKIRAAKRRIDDAMDFVHVEIQAALELDIPAIPVLVERTSVPHVRIRSPGALTHYFPFREVKRSLSKPFFPTDQNACRRQIRTTDQDVEAF